MSAQRAVVIAVIGAAACDAGQAQMAEEVGRLLAARGAILVCGGRGGVMEAACRGAFQAGGMTIGLLPGNDSSQGNPYLTVALPTGLGEARNTLVAKAGQAVIAVAGGYGTLSEIAFALKSGRRVVGLGSWEARSGSGEMASILQASSAEEAVKFALDVTGAQE